MQAGGGCVQELGENPDYMPLWFEGVAWKVNLHAAWARRGGLLGYGKEAIDLPFIFVFSPRNQGNDFILIFNVWIASSICL